MHDLDAVLLVFFLIFLCLLLPTPHDVSRGMGSVVYIVCVCVCVCVCSHSQQILTIYCNVLEAERSKIKVTGSKCQIHFWRIWSAGVGRRDLRFSSAQLSSR